MKHRVLALLLVVGCSSETEPDKKIVDAGNDVSEPVVAECQGELTQSADDCDPLCGEWISTTHDGETWGYCDTFCGGMGDPDLPPPWVCVDRIPRIPCGDDLDCPYPFLDCTREDEEYCPGFFYHPGETEM